MEITVLSASFNNANRISYGLRNICHNEELLLALMRVAADGTVYFNSVNVAVDAGTGRMLRLAPLGLADGHDLFCGRPLFLFVRSLFRLFNKFVGVKVGAFNI